MGRKSKTPKQSPQPQPGCSAKGAAAREQRKRMQEDHEQRQREQLKKQKMIQQQGPLHDPTAEGAIVLYPRGKDEKPPPNKVKVVLDPRIATGLQTHQKAGVIKMYDWLAGQTDAGFILADGMALGKTIQTISVLWTMLTQSPDWDTVENHVKPAIKKAIIVCPKSVVRVWLNEILKWLTPTTEPGATAETMKVVVIDDKVLSKNKATMAAKFMNPQDPGQCLILSYDTFKILTADNYGDPNKVRKKKTKNKKKQTLDHDDPDFDVNGTGTNGFFDNSDEELVPDENYYGPLFKNFDNAVDMLVCDEAHVIKNDDTQVSQAIKRWKVNKRIAITGTPIQNNLWEYYSIIDFVYPGTLPSKQLWHSDYVVPIGNYVQHKTDVVGKAALQKLKAFVIRFFIRRTKNPFVKVSKTEFIVSCKMDNRNLTNVQISLYNKFMEGFLQERQEAISRKRGAPKKDKAITGFATIAFAKNICDHPEIAYDICQKLSGSTTPQFRELKEICEVSALEPVQGMVEHSQSAKMQVLHDILWNIKECKDSSNDRVVIVSYHTTTLELIERMLSMKGWNFRRFDGSTSGAKRSTIIDDFNNPSSFESQFILTLSSRAGGCGISLPGANHLIMFDPDWNPANDEQAMSRIWREGQLKHCFIYRLLTTGSIEEKIFHKQISKRMLAGAVLGDETDNEGVINLDPIFENQNEITDLCQPIDPAAVSITHTQMECNRCENGAQRRKPSARDKTKVSDELKLATWEHHYSRYTDPETAIQSLPLYNAWDSTEHISFVFENKTEPKTEGLRDPDKPMTRVTDFSKPQLERKHPSIDDSDSEYDNWWEISDSEDEADQEQN